LRIHASYNGLAGGNSWRPNSIMLPSPPVLCKVAVKDIEPFNTTLAPFRPSRRQDTPQSDRNLDGFLVETIELAQMKQENVDWDFIVGNFDKTSRQRQNSLVRHRISKSVSMSARSVKSSSTYYSALSGSGSRKGTPRKRLQK
jgi:hypothetical protein